MVSPLFDTNILVDYLRGVPKAGGELRQYPRKAISIVTWMEVLVGVETENAPGTRAFLANFEVLELSKEVAERAVVLRRSRRIKLPDAVIWATAQVHSLLLVTRNSKDFPADDPGIRVPYIV